MPVVLVIPFWLPLLIALLALVCLVASLIALQETFRRGLSQLVPLAGAGLSVAYIVLNINLAATIALGPDDSATFRAWSWFAAHAISLVLVYELTSDIVCGSEYIQRWLKRRDAKKRT